MCQGRSTPYIGDKLIPPLIGNPYNGYISPYYWVDDHPLLHGNNGSLDPSTYKLLEMLNWDVFFCQDVNIKKTYIRKHECFFF